MYSGASIEFNLCYQIVNEDTLIICISSQFLHMLICLIIIPIWERQHEDLIRWYNIWKILKQHLAYTRSSTHISYYVKKKHFSLQSTLIVRAYFIIIIIFFFIKKSKEDREDNDVVYKYVINIRVMTKNNGELIMVSSSQNILDAL